MITWSCFSETDAIINFLQAYSFKITRYFDGRKIQFMRYKTISTPSVLAGSESPPGFAIIGANNPSLEDDLFLKFLTGLYLLPPLLHGVGRFARDESSLKEKKFPP